MNVFLTYTVIGVVVGATYAITASGLVVTYATSGVFNFAHGAIGMVAAFTYWELTVAHHLPTLVAVAIVLLVEGPVLGMLIEFVFMRRLAGSSAERPLMVTLGLLLIILGVAQAIWGNQTQRYVPAFFASNIPLVDRQYVRVIDVNLNGQQLITLLLAVVVAAALWTFLHKTRSGVAMRAVVDSPELLGMAGASPVRIASMGWIAGAVLASLAGILLAPKVSPLDINTITLIVVNGYAAAVVGKLKSLPMTFVGGAALGLMESYAIGYLPQSWQNSWLSNVQLALPMIFLFVILLVLPHEPLRGASALRWRVPRIAGRGESMVGAAGLVAGCLMISVVTTGTTLQTLTTGLAFGLVALSLVLLTGYGGQVCLAQLTFAGLGAFVMSRVAGGGSWWGLLAAAAASAVAGALVAVPTVRLRGIYLALSTLAFAQFATYAFFQNGNVFGSGGAAKVGRLGLPGVSFASDRVELVVLAIAFGLASVGVGEVRRSTFGRRMVALADSPAAGATVGLGVYPTRLGLFATAAGLAGVGGAMLGGASGLVGSNDFGLFGSMTLLLLLTIWGVRSLAGALLAGLSYAALPVLQSHLHAITDLVGLVTGIGIVAIGRLPHGLLGGERAHRIYSGLVRSRFGSQARVPLIVEAAEVATLSPDIGGSRRGGNVAVTTAAPDAEALRVLDVEGGELHPNTPIMEVTNVSVRFGGVTALDRVSLQVVPGRVTGLIGPNGAGKTTLFNVLSGLQSPDEGSVAIRGRPVASLGPHRRARLGMARTFQRLELFWSLSAGDNVRVAAEAKSRPAGARYGGCTSAGAVQENTTRNLLAAVGLPDISSEPAAALSTGTARLVEVARALATEPAVLLLDEPGSGLDESETESLGRLLADIAGRGVGILLVEHDMDLVMSVCSHLYVLDFGRIIASGTPEEIAGNPIVQAAYLGTVPVL